MLDPNTNPSEKPTPKEELSPSPKTDVPEPTVSKADFDALNQKYDAAKREMNERMRSEQEKTKELERYKAEQTHKVEDLEYSRMAEEEFKQLADVLGDEDAAKREMTNRGELRSIKKRLDEQETRYQDELNRRNYEAFKADVNKALAAAGVDTNSSLGNMVYNTVEKEVGMRTRMGEYMGIVLREEVAKGAKLYKDVAPAPVVESAETPAATDEPSQVPSGNPAPSTPTPTPTDKQGQPKWPTTAELEDQFRKFSKGELG